MPDDRDEDHTLAELRGPDDPGARRGLWARRLVIAMMLLVLVTAGTGWLGVHSTTVTASGQGYTLEVTYARIARAGLDVPFTVRITAPGAITDHVVLAVSADYFRMFETQGFYPEPSDVSSDSDTIYLTFAAPPSGNSLVVDYDAYIQPAEQVGHSATLTVITGGTERVSTSIHTTLMP